MEQIRKFSTVSWLLIVLFLAAFIMTATGNVVSTASWTPIAIVVLLFLIVGSVQNDLKKDE